MRRSFFVLFLLLAGLALYACNGSISSIGVPADSPWNSFETHFFSPYDDLTVVVTGSNITAGLEPTGVIAWCDSDQGHFISTACTPSTCGLAECVAGAPTGATNVTFDSKRFGYGLGMSLDRPAFNAGGVEVESATAGPVGAIALTLDAGSGLSVGAGFTEGWLPASPDDGTALQFDNAGFLLMAPTWEDFDNGYLCTDGTTTSCDPISSPEDVAVLCDHNTSDNGLDALGLRVDLPPGTYTLTCGSVPINLTINPAFASVGDCISSLKAQRCSGLKGQAKAACNHAQTGVCHATFNVPSAHNG
ncbi:MAG TPA: hypothetical protein VFH51_00180 [Myxococcota bacterium]|nr:hypothetical protein [Myxococcota bacterium]